MYLKSATQKHFVGSLDPDLERIPDGQVSVAEGLDLVGFKDPLVNKPLHVELVVVVKPEAKNSNTVNIQFPATLQFNSIQKCFISITLKS